jgi:di/tripeptidase
MNPTDHFEKIRDRVRQLPLEIERYRELLLANVIMLGEIPAPTFHEQERINLLEQRFTECGLQNCSVDEKGNGAAIIQGTGGDTTIMVAAHADTPFSANVDHTLTLEPDRIVGPGIADNSLGVAVLATLPTLLEGLGIAFSSDILLMSSVRSLNEGNQEGLRFFLSNTKRPITAALAVEGVQLGRLNFRSRASLGGEIFCVADKAYEEVSALDVLSQIIYRLRKIELPEESKTRLILGFIEGGVTYKTPARKARLKFQLSSDSDQTIIDITEKIDSLIAELSKEYRVKIDFNVIARTRYGGLDPKHFFVLQARRVLTTLGIHPGDNPYSSVVSGFVENNIPAMCIGITTGENLNYPDERIDISPIMKGVAQLIGLLMALDGGCCAEH